VGRPVVPCQRLTGTRHPLRQDTQPARQIEFVQQSVGHAGHGLHVEVQRAPRQLLPIPDKFCMHTPTDLGVSGQRFASGEGPRELAVSVAVRNKAIMAASSASVRRANELWWLPAMRFRGPLPFARWSMSAQAARASIQQLPGSPRLGSRS
jgi:hypothetical protein